MLAALHRKQFEPGYEQNKTMPVTAEALSKKPVPKCLLSDISHSAWKGWGGVDLQIAAIRRTKTPCANTGRIASMAASSLSKKPVWGGPAAALPPSSAMRERLKACSGDIKELLAAEATGKPAEEQRSANSSGRLVWLVS